MASMLRFYFPKWSQGNTNCILKSFKSSYHKRWCRACCPPGRLRWLRCRCSGPCRRPGHLWPEATSPRSGPWPLAGCWSGVHPSAKWWQVEERPRRRTGGWRCPLWSRPSRCRSHPRCVWWKDGLKWEKQVSCSWCYLRSFFLTVSSSLKNIMESKNGQAVEVLTYRKPAGCTP